MAEEKELTAEEKLDTIIRVFEKIDKAQDISLVSRYVQSNLLYAFAPTVERLVREITTEIRNL